MLYDPKWEAPTKADPLSLESLIAWLEKQPAYGEYCWMLPSHCLVGQWCRAAGIPEHEIGRKSLTLTVGAPFQHIALGDPYTYGAALARARAALTSAE